MSRKRRTTFDLDLGERIGKNPAQWLAWIIRFAQKDLATLRPEERVAFARDLAVFPFIVTQPRPTVGVTIDDAPIPEAMLRAIHEELGSGLRGLMSAPGHWTVPGLKWFKLLRITPRGSRLTAFLASWDAAGDARVAVLGAVANLLVKHGHKVRPCPECRKVFVAIRRQQYCDTRCSQRVRNQRRKLEESRVQASRKP